MTPAEVIAMRDRLIRVLNRESGLNPLDATFVANHLIRTGWVVAPPENEGENNE